MPTKVPRDEVPTLSKKELVIMEILLEEPTADLYGLELVRRSGKRLKRGTVYVTLTRLEDKGFIESREEVQPNMPGMPRRLYKVTGYGRKVYLLLRQASELRQLASVYLEGAI